MQAVALARSATVRDTGDVAYDQKLAQRIRDLLSSTPGITERRMFGGLAFLITGNMAVTASGEGGLLLRADPAEVPELCKEPGVEQAVMKGRVMTGWIRVPTDQVTNKLELSEWVDLAIKHTRTIPAK